MQNQNKDIGEHSFIEEPGTPLAEEGREQLELAELDQDDLLGLDIPSCDNLYLKGNPNIINNNHNPRKRHIEELSSISSDVWADQSVTEMDNERGFEEVDTYKPSLQFNDKITTPPIYPSLMDAKTEVSKKKYSSAQQVRFMNFCENEFMNIQRKYVQSRGLKAGENPKFPYYNSLLPLLKDFKRMMDFVWYSMDTSCKNTENLIPSAQTVHNIATESSTTGDDSSITEGHYSFKSLRRLLNEAQNIGQVYVLLKIADDLMEYIEKFETKMDSDQETIRYIFMLHFILDRVFSLLIVNDPDLRYGIYMSQTEIVRCKGICERTRVGLSKYFHECDIKGFHYELSKIYELTLESI